jgi:hypothetical protein
MKVWVLRSVGLAAIMITAALSLSCARNHDLEFIEVTPQTETLGIACSGPLPTDCAPTTNYTAIGHYIHPDSTQDVTSMVTWTTSNPDLIAFADSSHPNVLFPTGLGCGTGLQVQATLNVDSGNTKIGTATVNVNCGATGGSGSGSGGIDFSLTPNTVSQTVSPGGSAVYSIEVNVLSNSPTVGLNVNLNNLPSGISASLAPTSVTAPGFSQLTLTASPTQAANTYTVQIQGTDASGSAATQVNLVVQ